MTSIKTLAAASILALAAVAATPASATPFTSSFTISVWQGSNSGGKITDAAEQALPTNPLVKSSNLLATFTYKGALNFAEAENGANNIQKFLGTGGGTFSNFTAGSFSSLDKALSAGNFALTTVFEITGATNHALAGTISHDDGISLYQNGTNVLDVSASAPTSLSSTSYSNLTGGFNLWYVEANGLPANLKMDVTSVPEPASMALLGAGLTGLGITRRRIAASKAV